MLVESQRILLVESWIGLLHRASGANCEVPYGQLVREPEYGAAVIRATRTVVALLQCTIHLVPIYEPSNWVKLLAVVQLG